MNAPSDDLKAEFLRIWATGMPRRQIAAHFGKTASWVQWMTEVVGAPHRRLTIHNQERIRNNLPDDRLARRAYYKAANELKRAMLNFKVRLSEAERLDDLCRKGRAQFSAHKESSRRITNLALAVRTVAVRTERLREQACLDPLVTDADKALAAVKPKLEAWRSQKKTRS